MCRPTAVETSRNPCGASSRARNCGRRRRSDPDRADCSGASLNCGLIVGASARAPRAAEPRRRRNVARPGVRGIVPECRTRAKKARESPVCGGFGFYALMIVDETGVLRTRSWQRRTRDEAERNPLHPIRVIPAREVSGKRSFSSSSAFHAALGLGISRTPGRSRRWFRPLNVRLPPSTERTRDRILRHRFSRVPQLVAEEASHREHCCRPERPARARTRASAGFRRPRRRPVRAARRVATGGRGASRGALRTRRRGRYAVGGVGRRGDARAARRSRQRRAADHANSARRRSNAGRSCSRELPEPVFFQRNGTLVVWHAGDRTEAPLFERRLRANAPAALLRRRLRHAGGRAGRRGGAVARDRFTQGWLLPHEGQLDNRQVLSALAAGLAQRGVETHWNTPRSTHAAATRAS